MRRTIFSLANLSTQGAGGLSNQIKLSASNLSVGATQTAVLAGLNLEITAGKILVILGPNGSGKSTILKTLARLLKPLAGSVKLDDRDVSSLSFSEFAQKVAYVAQNVDPQVTLSIEEYVALGRTPHQKWWQWQQSDDDKAAVDAAIASTALTALKERPLSQLSGGEQQRAAIAIALAQKPTFMLLDEPTAHLDFKHQVELMRLLKKLKTEQQLGLIIVLHDLSAAAYLADEVLLLKREDGQALSVAETGAASEVLQESNLESCFGVKFKSTEERGELHYFVNIEDDGSA
jgi:iron complex transport system ATP-binding protein